MISISTNNYHSSILGIPDTYLPTILRQTTSTISVGEKQTTTTTTTTDAAGFVALTGTVVVVIFQNTSLQVGDLAPDDFQQLYHDSSAQHLPADLYHLYHHNDYHYRNDDHDYRF